MRCGLILSLAAAHFTFPCLPTIHAGRPLRDASHALQHVDVQMYSSPMQRPGTMPQVCGQYAACVTNKGSLQCARHHAPAIAPKVLNGGRLWLLLSKLRQIIAGMLNNSSSTMARGDSECMLRCLQSDFCTIIALKTSMTLLHPSTGYVGRHDCVVVQVQISPITRRRFTHLNLSTIEPVNHHSAGIVIFSSDSITLLHSPSSLSDPYIYSIQA